MNLNKISNIHIYLQLKAALAGTVYMYRCLHDYIHQIAFYILIFATTLSPHMITIHASSICNICSKQASYLQHRYPHSHAVMLIYRCIVYTIITKVYAVPNHFSLEWRILHFLFLRWCGQFQSIVLQTLCALFFARVLVYTNQINVHR